MRTTSIWDSFEDNIVRELDELENVAADYLTQPLPFGGLVSQIRANELSYYHFDGLGNTLSLPMDRSLLVSEAQLIRSPTEVRVISNRPLAQHWVAHGSYPLSKVMTCQPYIINGMLLRIRIAN